MIRLLFTFLAIFGAASSAIAQSQGSGLGLGGGGQATFCRTNEALASLATADGQANYVACTDYGQLLVVSADAGTGLSESVIPVSGATSFSGTASTPIGYIVVTTDSIEAASTTTVLNLTSHSARIGDVIKYRNGTAANIGVTVPVCAVTTNTVTLCKALPATPGTDAIVIQRPVAISAHGVDSSTAGYGLAVVLDSNNQTSATTGLLKLEDAAHSSGDAGVAQWGVINTGATSYAANGDYAPIAVDAQGGTLPGSVTIGTSVEGTLAFGSVSTTYATLVTNAVGRRIVSVHNGLNLPVALSADASVAFGYVGAGATTTFDLGASGYQVAGNISVKSLGGAPASGTVYAAAMRGP